MLKNLTAADWRHIRETVEQQIACYNPDDGETPEDVIMTSIGYLAVGCDGEDGSGYITFDGSGMAEDVWPVVVSADEAVALCKWDDESNIEVILEDFVREKDLWSAFERFRAERAAEELGESYVVDLGE